MASTFCALLTAFLPGNFALGPAWITERKRPIWFVVVPGAIVTSASCLLLGTFHWKILLVILVTLLVTGAIRAHKPSDSIASFLLSRVCTSLSCSD
jgi:hypothetical protein